MDKQNTAWSVPPPSDDGSQKPLKNESNNPSASTRSSKTGSYGPSANLKPSGSYGPIKKMPEEVMRKKTAGPRGLLGLQAPILLLALLATVFSGFAFYRANQVYTALNDGSAAASVLEAFKADYDEQVAGAEAELQQQAAPTGPVDVAVEADDPSMGPADAAVTIVEFSDFECPFCQNFSSTVDQLISEYGDQIRFVYRDFPLSFHENAEPAAIAAQCVYNLVGSQAFFDYHDELFENQSSLGDDLYTRLASEAGLNSDEFSNCLNSEEVKAEVQKDLQDGMAAGVQGTPATFINGELVSGAVPFEELKAKIDTILNQ